MLPDDKAGLCANRGLESEDPSFKDKPAAFSDASKDLEAQATAEDAEPPFNPDWVIIVLSYFVRSMVPGNVFIGRLLAVLTSLLLVYSAGLPFTPIATVLPAPGIWAVDIVFSHFALAGACYFHVYLGSLKASVPFVPPLCSPDWTFIRNRWLWRPHYFYAVVTLEVEIIYWYFLCSIKRPSNSHIVAMVLIAMWWCVGWGATSQVHREKAWHRIKDSGSWKASSRTPGKANGN
ncbi:hypothetical protein GQ53DRAFT_104958 [Thozetella sp. PMI_491]|nr:hypothetical protein GQ53DRAFT_104958 [Thozetella sp. PMI_491]